MSASVFAKPPEARREGGPCRCFSVRPDAGHGAERVQVAGRSCSPRRPPRMRWRFAALQAGSGHKPPHACSPSRMLSRSRSVSPARPGRSSHATQARPCPGTFRHVVPDRLQRISWPHQQRRRLPRRTELDGPLSWRPRYELLTACLRKHVTSLRHFDTERASNAPGRRRPDGLASVRTDRRSRT